jgi:hypothetical protein
VFAAFVWGGQNDKPGVLGLNTNTPQPKKHASKPVANLVASSVNGGSYLAVYRGARTGRPIYEGTLESGRKHRFVGKHLWVWVYAPANLRLRLNGKLRPVPGAGTGSRRWLEVTPTQISLAPPA